MCNQESSRGVSQEPSACSQCGGANGFPRVDLYARCVVSVCDSCCDRNATTCPFCDSPFGREVKRASRCKKCGETVARNSRSRLLATRLATQAVCEALAEIDTQAPSDSEKTWLESCLLACLLDAAMAGRNAQVIDAAFATALRSNFERGLTHDRLRRFGLGFALAIWTCGGNPRPIQRTLHRVFLEGLRGAGSSASLEILPAGDPCEKCETLAGRAWTIAEALAENPLPCRDCLNTNANGFGWCRCEYQQRLPDHLEAIIRDSELSGEIEAERRRINAAAGNRQPDGNTILTQSGAYLSVEEAASIASNGWHLVRNRGNRGLHDGCNGALDALRKAGVLAGTVPNRERPVFNDILLAATDGRPVVLMLCTSTWEFIRRKN
jgi:hypothetical protein